TVSTHVVAAVRIGLADGDVGVALAAVGLVDATPGHPADHRTDCGPHVAATAVADLAAEHRAGDAADHSRDHASVVVAPRLAVAVAIAVGGVTPIAVVVVTTIGIAGHVAVAARLAVTLPLHRPTATVEYRIHAQHACPVVLSLVVSIVLDGRIG